MKSILGVFLLLGSLIFACPNSKDHKFVESLEDITMVSKEGFDGRLAFIFNNELELYHISLIQYIKEKE